MKPKFNINDRVRILNTDQEVYVKRIIMHRYINRDYRGFTEVFEGEYECTWVSAGKIKSDYFKEDQLLAL